MHDAALQKLRATGRSLGDDLEILPLPMTPTLDELKDKSLDALRLEACRRVKDLPKESVSKFFNRLHREGQQRPQMCIHFLVWLPSSESVLLV